MTDLELFTTLVDGFGCAYDQIPRASWDTRTDAILRGYREPWFAFFDAAGKMTGFVVFATDDEPLVTFDTVQGWQERRPKP